jgi:hypothetical protein
MPDSCDIATDTMEDLLGMDHRGSKRRGRRSMDDVRAFDGLLPLRETGYDGRHLWRSDAGRVVKSRSGREQSVVIGGLPDSGDVIEVTVRIEEIQQVEQRVRVAAPAPSKAVAVSEDRRPERR